MSGVQHYDQAIDTFRVIDSLGPRAIEEQSPRLLSLAQAHATLALVEEQRTANLLALLALDEAARDGRGVRVLSPGLRDSLVAQAGARLGIEGVR